MLVGELHALTLRDEALGSGVGRSNGDCKDRGMGTKKGSRLIANPLGVVMIEVAMSKWQCRNGNIEVAISKWQCRSGNVELVIIHLMFSTGPFDCSDSSLHSQTHPSRLQPRLPLPYKHEAQASGSDPTGPFRIGPVVRRKDLWRDWA